MGRHQSQKQVATRGKGAAFCSRPRRGAHEKHARNRLRKQGIMTPAAIRAFLSASITLARPRGGERTGAGWLRHAGHRAARHLPGGNSSQGKPRCLMLRIETGKRLHCAMGAATLGRHGTGEEDQAPVGAVAGMALLARGTGASGQAGQPPGCCPGHSPGAAPERHGVPADSSCSAPPRQWQSQSCTVARQCRRALTNPGVEAEGLLPADYQLTACAVRAKAQSLTVSPQLPG
jgi:hypothetical protein